MWCRTFLLLASGALLLASGCSESPAPRRPSDPAIAEKVAITLRESTIPGGILIAVTNDTGATTLQISGGDQFLAFHFVVKDQWGETVPMTPLGADHSVFGSGGPSPMRSLPARGQHDADTYLPWYFDLSRPGTYFVTCDCAIVDTQKQTETRIVSRPLTLALNQGLSSAPHAPPSAPSRQ
jgi:hypothetical protein